jgi:APA family basic amino acid/polyamine antiporter
MGRRNDLPSAFGEVHKKYKVPYNAQITASAIMMVVVALGNLAFAAFLTSLTILMYYALTNLSALKLKKRYLLFPRFVAVLGFLGCVALAIFIPLTEWAVTLVLVLIGLAYCKFGIKR